MNQGTRSLLSVGAALIGLAALSVVLSSRANTSQVITTTAQAAAGTIGAATAPVTG